MYEKRCTSFVAAFVIFATLQSSADAQLYWDINGANPGASDTGDATGTWNASSLTWNTASDGSSAAPGTWVADSVAVFSAGSSSTPYTVTLGDAESASGITFQDSLVTLAATGAGQLTLTGTATITVPSATTQATISAPIAGLAGLNATGGATDAGVLVLSGANTYSGPTTISGGLIAMQGAANVIPDSSALTLVHGTFASYHLNGFDETVRSIDSTGTGQAPTLAIGSNTLTINDQAGDDNTFAGLYTTTAGGKIVKNGDGILTLNNFPTSFSGGEFNLNSGVVVIGQNSVFGTNANGSKLTLNGGTLRKASGGAGSNVSVANIDITNSFNVDFTANNDLQFIGSAGSVVTTLKADNPTITVTGGASSGGELIFAGNIVDDGNIRGFTKAGPGTMIFGSPNNAYRGETTIQEGFLRVRKQTLANANGAARIGDGNGRVNLSGGTLEYNGSVLAAGDPRTFTVTNPIRLTADSGMRYFSSILNLGTTNTIELRFTSNDISGTGGTLTLSNAGSCTDNSSTCAFLPTFTGSGFDFGRPIEILNHTDVATRGTVLTSANTTGTQTWSGAISGTGSLKRTGAGGTTVLTGANSYAGGTTVEDGMLRAGGAAASFGSGNVTVTGGILDIASGVTNAIGNAATLDISGTGMADLGAGINEFVAGLVLGSSAQGLGTYGSSSSSAMFQFDQWFSGTGIITVAAATLDGDYNGDDKVDAADYVLWRKNPSAFGGNPGGYNTWRQHFGEQTGGGSAAVLGAVPEPASVTLLVLGLVLVCATRLHSAAQRIH